MDWLTITPPIVAIIVAIWTRNVFWALGLAIWLSETIIAGFNPFMGALGGIDRAVGVFDSPYNTRVLLFCLIIGALIVYMHRSGGISAMVERLQSSGFASTPRRASLVTAICGVLIFVETNISLLTTGILGRPLFDKLKISRERLAYIIDSTCAPVSVLILFNGWGAYLLGLLNENGVDGATGVLMATIGLNFYAWITLVLVFFTVFSNKTFGPLAAVERSGSTAVAASGTGMFNEAPAPASKAIYMALPLIVMIGGTIAFMLWTGNGDIREGSGSQAILWSVILGTVVAFLCLAHSRRAKGELLDIGFKGMGETLAARSVASARWRRRPWGMSTAISISNSLRRMSTRLPSVVVIASRPVFAPAFNSATGSEASAAAASQRSASSAGFVNAPKRSNSRFAVALAVHSFRST